MSTSLLGLLSYLLVQFVIAGWVFRRISTTRSYFIADRTLGPVLATFSLFATWFGAETCIGSAGVIYSDGLSGGRADPFGYALCLLLTGVFIAARIWNGQYLTVGDLLRRKFDGKVEKLASAIVVISSLFWAAAQIRAFSQVIGVVTGIQLDSAMLIAAGVVILYTTFGGLLADVITDMVQGIVLAIGLIILGGALWMQQGSPVETIALQSAQRLSFVGSGESLLQTLDSWLIPILGSLYAQELFARVMASRSKKIAQSSAIHAFWIYLLIGSIPVWIGLVGPSQFPGLKQGEQILPLFAQSTLSPFFFVIFSGALVSAILSTVDSTLLSAGSLLSQNLIGEQRRGWSERKQLFIARASVVGSGVVAYSFAAHSERIYDLVEEASSFGASGFFVVMTMAILNRKLSSKAAFYTLLVGLVSTLGFQFFELEAPFFYSLTLCFSFYFGAQWIERLVAQESQYFESSSKHS